MSKANEFKTREKKIREQRSKEYKDIILEFKKGELKSEKDYKPILIKNLA